MSRHQNDWVAVRAQGLNLNRDHDSPQNPRKLLMTVVLFLLHSFKLAWKWRGASCKTTILYVRLSMSFHVHLAEGSSKPKVIHVRLTVRNAPTTGVKLSPLTSLQPGLDDPTCQRPLFNGLQVHWTRKMLLKYVLSKSHLLRI